MRKWHRWLSVTFGVVLLWIAITGALSQVVPMVLDTTQPQSASAAPAAQAAGKPAFECPPDYLCRPKPKDGDPRALIGTLHHLHSGESFGTVGVVIATLAGFSMIFFSFSGLWLYISMWRNRAERNLKPGWFWR